MYEHAQAVADIPLNAAQESESATKATVAQALASAAEWEGRLVARLEKGVALHTLAASMEGSLKAAGVQLAELHIGAERARSAIEALQAIRLRPTPREAS